MEDTKTAKTLEDVLRESPGGAVIMRELTTKDYFQESVVNIRQFLDRGFEGVYISFQRPFKNLTTLLEKESIDTNKMMFIDAATAVEGSEQKEGSRCMHVSSDLDVDSIIRAIHLSLQKLNGGGKFIFIDSLTTFALYKPLSEILRFSEFLKRLVRNTSKESVYLVFNVSKDLAQKRFIRDIALEVDKIIDRE